jgi:UDP-N-acetylglucosamine 2-epimerase (non-hydrolysing)
MRNIAVFTCNRADEGPMGPVLKALGDRGDLNLWHINWQDSSAEHPWIIWPEWKPEVLLLLGDRHELLAASHQALLHQVPIAHIHGGETTLGSFDDRVRNAVSQLATLHFTAAQQFSDKLRAMKVPGEIFTVGPPGLDDLETDDVSEFGSGFFLVCLHPDTTQGADYNAAMTRAVCEAIDRFPERDVLVVQPNGDPHGQLIWTSQLSWWQQSKRKPPMFACNGLDRRRYLTALKHAAVCIGNSSSFVIEAPALGTPTVLVGDRQRGRPLAETIWPASPNVSDITRGIDWALKGLRPEALACRPYGRGGASQKIADILANWSP